MLSTYRYDARTSRRYRRLVEQPYDVQKALQMFEESNRFYATRS